MARYLVTGGAGFIGSHLVESLVIDGHEVRVLDNLSSGKVENLPPGIDLTVADITDQREVRTALENVDGCFHLAAIASVESCHNDWLGSHAVNLGGTVTVFDEVCRTQTQRSRPIGVVYASSAAVYGNVSKTPISEDTMACPANAYGADKFGCELHASVGSLAHNLNAIGLRFFNVYGPRQDPSSPYSGVISIFCQQILNGAPIEIHGDGGQVRDFVFVEDAVNALRRAMDAANPDAQIFNVCTGIGTSIRQLAQSIARICDLPLRTHMVPARVGDLRTSIGDPARARARFGFSATKPLRQGLARTIDAIMPPASQERTQDRLLLIKE